MSKKFNDVVKYITPLRCYVQSDLRGIWDYQQKTINALQKETDKE